MSSRASTDHSTLCSEHSCSKCVSTRTRAAEGACRARDFELNNPIFVSETTRCTYDTRRLIIQERTASRMSPRVKSS